MSAAASREKEGLLLTCIDYTAWLVVHSSYTKRRGVKKSLRMINTPSATQLSKNLCHLSRSVSSHFTTSSPRAVNVHAPATPPKRLFSPSSPTLHCVLVLKSSLRSENIACCLHTTRGCVKLLSKQTYETLTTHDIHIQDFPGSISTSSCGHGSPTYFVRPTAARG